MEGKRLDHPWLDGSEYPLLRVTYPPNGGTEEENVALFEAVEAFYAEQREPFAWVVDASRMRLSNPRNRRVTVAHERRVKDYMRRHNAGTAFVITSRVVRGLLAAVYWMAPPPYPHDIFTDLESARAWAKAQLDRRLAATA